MKLLQILLFTLVFSTEIIAQKIAFQQIQCVHLNSKYVNDRVAANLIDDELNITSICDTELDYYYENGDFNNTIYSVNSEKLRLEQTLLLGLGYDFLLVPMEGMWIAEICTSDTALYESNRLWWCRFYIYNLNGLEYKEVKLIISTSNATDLSLEACSNIADFVSQVKDFIQEGSSTKRKKEKINLRVKR